MRQSPVTMGDPHAVAMLVMGLTRQEVTNTVASVQSNYAAWPASIPASHAALRWRPCIQPASEIRLALFFFKPSTNFGLFTSASSKPMSSTLHSSHHPSFIQALGQVLPRALFKPLHLERILSQLPKGLKPAKEIDCY